MRERCLSWTFSEGKYNDNDTIIKEDMVLVSCSHYGNAFFVIAGFCCKQTVPYEDTHDDDDDDDGDDDDNDSDDDNDDDDDGGDDAADDDEGDDGNDVNAERVGLVVYYI